MSQHLATLTELIRKRAQRTANEIRREAEAAAEEVLREAELRVAALTDLASTDTAPADPTSAPTEALQPA